MGEDDPGRMPPSGDRRGLVYHFGEYRLDASEGLLRKNGREVQLTPTVLEVLRTLVESSGRTLEKKEFMERVWAGRIVEDGNLARNISTLRDILDDDPRHPRYIETVPRRGYRFIEAVERRPKRAAPGRRTALPHGTPTAGDPVAHPSHPQGGEPGARKRPLLTIALAATALAAVAFVIAATADSGGEASASPIGSLVVLPLQDMSAEPDGAYFSDGMTEMLISNLNRISGLKVIARTSAMRYRNSPKLASEIGDELGVEGVVEGSVARSGDRVRVTIRLVEAATNQARWTQTFARDFDDVLSLQSEIARTIARRVRVAVTPEERRRLAAAARPVDAEANKAYLLGLGFQNRRTVESLHKAIDYFEEALEIEPEFAPAYAAMANAYLSLASWQGPARELWGEAREAANRALQIDENLAEAHLVIAGALLCHDLNQSAAEDRFHLALDLNPGDAMARLRHAYSLMTQGRFEESIAEARASVGIDPASPETNAVLGGILAYAGRHEQARQQLLMTLELEPGYPPAHRALGRIYLETGKPDQAIAALERALALGGGQGAIGELGYAYSVAGRVQDARRQLEILEEMSRQARDSAFSIALIHHGLGDTDEAFTWLRRAYEERDFRMIRLLVDSFWDDVRDDPRFEQLLLRIGLRPSPAH